MPLGIPPRDGRLRNAEMSLSKERAKLQEGELELSHQLAFAVRNLETNYVLSQTNFNRRIAARRNVEAVTAAYETDTVTIDRVLDAQQKLAEAESQYYRSLVDYNKSIAQVHFEKALCWSIMASTWPKDRGRRRRISMPDAAPTNAKRRPTSTTASHSRGLSAAGRSSRMSATKRRPTPASRKRCRRPRRRRTEIFSSAVERGSGRE